MRADRLITIILLLRTHGKLSGTELAGRLEVSLRTIQRDIDALCSSGIPVEADFGPAGGYSLTRDSGAEFTGLLAEELLPLFLRGSAKPERTLGLERESATALLKLAAALPDVQRERLLWYGERIHIDPEPDEPGEPEATRILASLQDAVFRSECVTIHVTWPREEQSGDYTVRPLALVSSGDAWYLAASVDDFIRVYPVRVISDVRREGGFFLRPDSFDLPSFWKRWKTGMNLFATRFAAVLEVAPELLRELAGLHAEPEGGGGPGGAVRLRVDFQSFESARRFALTHGDAVKVLEPKELRYSVADFASRTLGLYRGLPDGAG